MKSLKYLGVVLVMLLGFVIGNMDVKAASLTREWLDNTFGIFISDDYYSFPEEIFRMDGRIAYCLEPGVHITSSIYNEDVDMGFLSDQQKEYVKLVSYYGYGYPSHDDVKYYLAAQELIWEAVVDGGEGYWVTTQDVHGERIDVEKEKNDILWLVNNPDMIKPSFDGMMLVVKKGERGEFIDNNGVLGDYELVGDYGKAIRIDGNKLVVATTGKVRKWDIVLKKKQYVSDPVLWYYVGDSQKMVSVGVKNDVTSSFTVKVDGGKLSIKKKGEEVIIDNGKYEYKEIDLENVKFALYAGDDIITEDGVKHYSKNEKIMEFVTSKLGEYSSYLYTGKYYIKEICSVSGNMLDDKRYDVEIFNDEDVVTELEFKNYLPKGELVFQKFDADTKEGILDTLIEIYTMNDELVYRGKTDSLGKVVIDDLFVGRFYLIEKEASDGYIKTDEKLYFEILENGQVVNVSLDNERIEVPVTGKNKGNGMWLVVLGVLGWFGYEIKQEEN